MGIFSKLAEWDARWTLRAFMRGARRFTLDVIPEATRGRVTGVIKPLDGGLLDGPVSGRRCVYYAVEIHDIRANGSDALLASEQRRVPFVLEDATGRAVVDPTHARVSCAFSYQSYSKAAFDADPRQRALLNRFELVHRDWWNTTRLHYREAVISVDTSITVVGTGVREPDAGAPPTSERGYREGGPTRMHFSGTKKQPLVLTDDPRLA